METKYFLDSRLLDEAADKLRRGFSCRAISSLVQFGPAVDDDLEELCLECDYDLPDDEDELELAPCDEDDAYHNL